MEIFDYSIIAVYILGLMAMGLYFSRRQAKKGEYFLASRSMGSIPVGLSIMATAFSAVNYVAFSGEVFANGLYIAMSLPVFILVAWPVTRIFMPFYHSMKLCSAYEYLEYRFDLKVRLLASSLFILWRIAWMALAVFIPAKILSVIAGLDLQIVIVFAGVLAMLYTITGGMAAVMWTDVFQFIVIIASLIGVVIIASLRHVGGFGGMMTLGVDSGLARPFSPYDPAILGFDPNMRISLWSALVGTFIMFLTRYAADQVVLQRYFAARDLKSAIRGFRLNYISAIIALSILVLLGFAINAHVQSTSLAGKLGSKPIPYFIMFIKSMPTGILGLVIAALAAAAMSSIDSGINSCSAAWLTDFHMRLGRSEETPGIMTKRALTVVFGIIVTVGALGVEYVPQSIFGVMNRIINAIGSPLLGMILLGMFSHRANSMGVFLGGLTGIVFSLVLGLCYGSLALHGYIVLDLLVTVFCGYIFSILSGLKLELRVNSSQLAWTFRQRLGK